MCASLETMQHMCEHLHVQLYKWHATGWRMYVYNGPGAGHAKLWVMAFQGFIIASPEVS